MLAEGDGVPVARCGLCKREVLTHVRLDRADELCRCCVECDALLDPLEVRWVPEDEFRLGGGGGAALETSGCGAGGCGTGGCGR